MHFGALYWGERSEPLPSQLNVNFVCLSVCVSWTGSTLASKDDALYRVDCYVGYSVLGPRSRT